MNKVSYQVAFSQREGEKARRLTYYQEEGEMRIVRISR